MMRVALNLATLSSNGGGITQYSLALARTLSARSDVQLTMYVSHEIKELARRATDGKQVRVEVLDANRGQRVRYARTLFAQLPSLARSHGADVLHSPGNFGPAWNARVPCVTTVHDVIWHDAGSSWGTRSQVWEMRMLSKLAVPRMAGVITDSEYSAQRLIDVLHVDPDRLTVAPLGVSEPGRSAVIDERIVRQRFGLGDDPVVLCVAQKRPYKRQDVLLRALAAMDAPCVLVLPGSATAFEVELRGLAESLGVASKVRFLPWISDEDLEALYSVATCVALPSAHEGFGLPVLEAMVRGVPVACSCQGALGEAAGEAALSFETEDVPSVTRTISALIEDRQLRAELAERGRAHARGFTWEQTAELTVEAYRRAIAIAR